MCRGSVGGQVEHGQGEPSPERCGHRVGVGDQRESFPPRMVQFVLWCRRGRRTAVDAQDGGDGVLPGLCGNAGVDHGGGLLREALFHQRHDRELAAVEKPLTDAAVRGHGFGCLGPTADAREGSGTVDQQGDPQLRTDLAVVCDGPDQRRQVDVVIADDGGAALLGGPVQLLKHREGIAHLHLHGSGAGRYSPAASASITAMSWSRLPASAKTLCCRQHSSAARSGMPTVGGDQRGEVKDTAGAGHPLGVVRAGRFDGQRGELCNALVQWKPGGLGRQTSGIRAAIAGFITLLSFYGQSMTSRLLVLSMMKRESVAFSRSRLGGRGHAEAGGRGVVAVVAVPFLDRGGDLLGEGGGARAVTDDADLPEPAHGGLHPRGRSDRPGCRRRAPPSNPTRNAG